MLRHFCLCFSQISTSSVTFGDSETVAVPEIFMRLTEHPQNFDRCPSPWSLYHPLGALPRLTPQGEANCLIKASTKFSTAALKLVRRLRTEGQ